MNGTALAKMMLSEKRWPWRSPKQRNPILAALATQLLVGGVLSAVLAASDRIRSPLVAFVSGVAAPLILERLMIGALAAIGIAAHGESGPKGGSGDGG